jgi:hypothetical protein
MVSDCESHGTVLPKLGSHSQTIDIGYIGQPMNLNLPFQLPTNVLSSFSIQFAKFQQVRIFSNLHCHWLMAKFLVALWLNIIHWVNVLCLNVGFPNVQCFLLEMYVSWWRWGTKEWDTLSQPHFEGSVRSPLTFSKMGPRSPSGLPKIQNVIAGVKTPCIEVFFIPLKRSWSVDVQNGLAWAVWTSTTQVMVERRAGSQIGNLTPDH